MKLNLRSPYYSILKKPQKLFFSLVYIAAMNFYYKQDDPTREGNIVSFYWPTRTRVTYYLDFSDVTLLISFTTYFFTLVYLFIITQRRVIPKGNELFDKRLTKTKFILKVYHSDESINNVIFIFVFILIYFTVLMRISELTYLRRIE